MAYLVEFHAITKILLTLTLRKITKKIPKNFNYQKSQKNREILPKVIKITKSGHTALQLRKPSSQISNFNLRTGILITGCMACGGGWYMCGISGIYCYTAVLLGNYNISLA
jgi:hypothetical protein